MHAARFAGLTGETSEEATRKISKLDGSDISVVQKILDIKNRGTTKAEKVSVLVDFLKNPTVQHGSAAIAKKRPAAAKKATPKKRKARDDDSDDDDDDDGVSDEIAQLKKKLAALEKRTKGSAAPKTKAKTTAKTTAKAPAKKKPRKARVPKPVRTGPKKALSAYFCWMPTVRSSIKEENPDLTVGELAKKMGKVLVIIMEQIYIILCMQNLNIYT